MNGRPSKRVVLLVIGAACLAMFIAGVGAFWVNRHHTLCSDGKLPVAQQQALLGQTAYRCHNGQIVTTG